MDFRPPKQSHSTGARTGAAQRFRDFPVKLKITTVVMLASMVTLIMAATSLYCFQRWNTRRIITRDLLVQGQMIAATSTASLRFQDQDAANEILASLSAKPHMLHACLRPNTGRVLGTYGRDSDPLDNQISSTESATLQFARDAADLLQPVMLNGQTIGMLHLKFDVRAMEREILGPFLFILAAVLLAALLLAVALSAVLQPLISRPILRLTDAAHRVADQRDYTVRAPAADRDEIGTLTQAFNMMLEEIQVQHTELQRSQQRTEALVHSIDGIVWECTADTLQFTFISRQVERILGYTPAQWMGSATFWEDHLYAKDAAAAREARRQLLLRQQPLQAEYRMIAADGRVVWIRQSGTVIIEQNGPVTVRGIFLDITAQKTAAEELVQLNRRLMEISRQAGMAEVATGVLHNVGNVLNSVNVSCTLVLDRVRQSEIANLAKLSALLDQQDGRLTEFLTQDSRGRQLPAYLRSLLPALLEEQSLAVRELGSLRDKIDHMKEIVAMQQNYARISGVIETVSVDQLVEDALKLNAGALARHAVQVKRDFEEVPAITTDRHKVLQVLLNLIRNAKYACDESEKEFKLMTLRIFQRRPKFVCVQVIDNGVGIPEENLVKIFSHGFTTRRDGHGFGLHSGALAAKELGGTLVGESAGPGHGATFTLELPCEAKRSSS